MLNFLLNFFWLQARLISVRLCERLKIMTPRWGFCGRGAAVTEGRKEIGWGCYFYPMKGQTRESFLR